MAFKEQQPIITTGKFLSSLWLKFITEYNSLSANDKQTYLAILTKISQATLIIDESHQGLSIKREVNFNNGNREINAKMRKLALKNITALGDEAFCLVLT